MTLTRAAISLFFILGLITPAAAQNGLRLPSPAMLQAPQGSTQAPLPVAPSANDPRPRLGLTLEEAVKRYQSTPYDPKESKTTAVR